MSKTIKFSVLMSVYENEKPHYLDLSLNSIFNQTVKPNEVILVEDGPLNDELYRIINLYKNKYKNFRVVTLNENQGLGKALNKGLKYCKYEYVARMDSDDYSLPTRFEKQISYLFRHPDISIIGSTIKEFSNSVDCASIMRAVPEYNEQITNFSKMRNPFNHPSVIFKKEDVLSVGGYKNVRNLQDYFLWIDMLLAGFKGYNIQEPLVYMRADDNLFKRRSGKKYVKIQVSLLKYMRDRKFINKKEYIKSRVIRTCSGYAPNRLRKYLFKKTLRKQSN